MVNKPLLNPWGGVGWPAMIDGVCTTMKNLVFGQNCQIPRSSLAHWTVSQVRDMRRIRSHLPQPEYKIHQIQIPILPK